MTDNQLKAIKKQAKVIKFWAKIAIKAKYYHVSIGRSGFVDGIFGVIFTETEHEFKMRKEKHMKAWQYAEIRLQKAIERLTELT
jgi:hypothetical protein